MNKQKIQFIGLLVFTLFFSKSLIGQIVVSSAIGQAPQILIDNKLAGDGVELSNGSFNWSAGNISTSNIGYFTNGPAFTAFPFLSGIIMTTGNINVAIGPNNSGSASQAITNGTTTRDANLQALATSPLNSTTVLEFDFLAYSGFFEFQYVFASEEYPEFVCSSFNDVFAFFLSGTDPITGMEFTHNIAIIPNSITAANPNGLPVAINTVNPGTAGSSGSPGGCQSLAYSSYYTSNTGNHIQYDGYTTALTASAVIRACRQYHMKLSIANVGDNGYDSGVFLKEGSFTSPEIEKINMFAIDNDTLIKNCNDLNIKLKLNKPNTRSNNIEVMASGTAILNSDYAITWNDRPINSGDNITFLEGDTILSLHVFPLPDATFTAGEAKKIIIYLAIELCDYTPLHEGPVIKYDTLEYYLIDNDFVRLTSEEHNFCNVCQQVAINVESGTEPLLFSWFPATGIVTPNTQTSEANITRTTTYSVIASDRWGCQSDTAQYRVGIQPRPKIEVALNPKSGCVPLTVNFNSNSTPDGATHTWVINHTDTLTETNPSKTFTDAGLYSVYLHVSSAPNCNDSLYLENAIRVSDYPHAHFYYSPEEPLNGRPVNFTNTSTGENITNFLWNFGDGSSSSMENPDHSYHVNSDELFNVLLTVSNIDGCENDTLIQLKVADQYAFWVPKSFSPNHDGINDIFLPKVNDLLKYHLQIYDRFGNCIFNSVDPATGWDGTYKKDNCQMGVYVWKITYITYTNTDMELVKFGSVVLVR